MTSIKFKPGRMYENKETQHTQKVLVENKILANKFLNTKCRKDKNKNKLRPRFQTYSTEGC